MNLTVMSMFRDSTHQTERYREQILSQEGFEKIQCCWLEGDSQDRTYDVLDQMKSELNASLIQKHTGRQRWGPIACAARMAHLGELGEVLRNATLTMSRTDFVVYVESDLIIRDTQLFKKLAEHNVDTISPITYHHHGELFYDTWGYLDKDGRSWGPNPPFSEHLKVDGLCPMTSVGSCVMMKWEVLENTHWGPDAFRSFCSNVLSNGYKIWVDKELSIYHPKIEGYR